MGVPGGRNVLARFDLSQATLSHPTNPNNTNTKVSHTHQEKQQLRYGVPHWNNQSFKKKKNRWLSDLILKMWRDNTRKHSPCCTATLFFLYTSSIAFLPCFYSPAWTTVKPFKGVFPYRDKTTTSRSLVLFYLAESHGTLKTISRCSRTEHLAYLLWVPTGLPPISAWTVFTVHMFRGNRDTMLTDTLLNAENGEIRIGIRPPRGELASQCVRHWQLACCSERRSGSIVAGALWPWLLQWEPPGMSVQPCDANATVDHWQAQLALAWIIKPYFLIQAKFHPNLQPHQN